MSSFVTEWATRVVEALGPVGVALLVAIESVFPPIPSEAILPMAGFVAGRGDTALVAMVVAATAGSVVGALVLYGVAAAIGIDRLGRLVDRRGRWFGVGAADLARAEAWFVGRGDWAVLVGRCVPLVRSLVSIPAGLGRMPLGRFVVLTAIGSAIWNTALIGAGAALGARWHQVSHTVDSLQWVVVAIAVAGLAGWVWRRRRRAIVLAEADA